MTRISHPSSMFNDKQDRFALQIMITRKFMLGRYTLLIVPTKKLTENRPVTGSSLKNLKFSMDILTFIAIPNKFWKGKGFV